MSAKKGWGRRYDEFTSAYVCTALRDSSDESTPSGGYPLDKNYGVEDIAPETLEEMKRDCVSFQEKHWDDIAADVERAGCDFWLTRNGAGAGFWDGDWPDDVGERLTAAAQEFGGYNLYIGDDGQIWGCKG